MALDHHPERTVGVVQPEPDAREGPGLSEAGTARLPARVAALPIGAAAALAMGGAAWLVGRVARMPAAGVFADRAWLAGLIIFGAPVVWRTMRAAARGHFATDVVAMLAIITAVVLDEPLAGLVIVLMQTGGEALERYAEGRASAAVRALEEAAPRLAHRVVNGRIEDVASDAVAVGDVLLVRPGEMLPCDATVTEGGSSVDTARLTGEPAPVSALPGVRLLSGSVNGEGTLTVRVTAVARESQYARIVELVRTAQASKAPIQRLADRYALWFTPLTLAVCAAAWAASGNPRRALAVLVVATPCPLILATPIAIIGGFNRAARRHIIIRHGGALERLEKMTIAVFDKTGTLTIGRPEVSRVVTADGWSLRDVLRLSGAVEQGAGHLLARTLVAAAEHELAGEGGLLPRATQVVEAPGQGVSGTVEGREVTVGARSFVAARACDAPSLAALDARFPENGALRAYVAVDGCAVGVVEYADSVRPGVRDVLADLASLGIQRTILLSGDHSGRAHAVAAAVGITEAEGDLLPEGKVERVRELVEGGLPVLMVGDGTNDAPALSSATVGVALAAHGGGITAEAADIVVLADDLARVPEAIRISRRTMHIARQSLMVGLGLSGVAMIVAALGFIAPALGALLQEAIDVAVIMNALRTSM